MKRLQIFLASPRGFCAGVERAITIVERALSVYNHPIYVYHEIVHNKYIVNSFKKRGVIFVDKISDIPFGALVIFSAHGVSNEVERCAKAQNLQIIDASCPLVKKVHREAKNYSDAKKQIILVGHPNHPEVEGTKGRVENDMVYIVQNKNDVKDLNISEDNDIAYITQTTLSVDDTQEIIKELRKKFPKIQGPSSTDICYATQNRQNAVKKIAKNIQMLIVIGSANSSNSNRLCDIGKKMGITSYLIENSNAFDKNLIGDTNSIGITSGASAPEVLVQELLNDLQRHFILDIQNVAYKEENVHFNMPKELL
ncbi:MAG: 4-hydroxy-3-methylbut-2-enyl diphosphate reductase [Proteobacteria bacterium]|nr:4-hydroxy-3-methylbut-2-enyl diphosphate reductase [Pseudomonadota bacterium]